MIKFYYYPICPLSQKIQWMLMIYDIEFYKIPIITKEDYSMIKDVLEFSPLPLIDLGNKYFLRESLVISDYLQYNYDNKKNCFYTKYIENITDVHFYRDVYMNIVYERTLKNIFINQKFVNTNKIYEGINYMKKYLMFFENILSTNHWINGFEFSPADISFFTQLMCLDYCGQVPWFTIPEIKKWYMRIKCKKETQNLLKERIMTFQPPPHYELLDF